MSKRKAEINCSGASGSLAFFSSFLGLHVPVSQKRLKRSKSPKIKTMQNLKSKFLQTNRKPYFCSIFKVLLTDIDDPIFREILKGKCNHPLEMVQIFTFSCPSCDSHDEVHFDELENTA